MRQPFAPDELDEVILGCAAPSVDEVNIGRVAALRMGCGQKVPGWTVMRNCASGMQAVDSGINNILAGRSQPRARGRRRRALARAAALRATRWCYWFSDMAAAKTTGQRLALFARLPVRSLLAPVIGIMKGLTDPMVGLLMGQTAENLAHRFGITREQMDAFSVRSHQRVAQGAGRRQRWRPAAAKSRRSTTATARSFRSTTACGATPRRSRSRSCGRSSTASTAT